MKPISVDGQSLIALLRGMLDDDPDVCPLPSESGSIDVLTWELHGQRLTIVIPDDGTGGGAPPVFTLETLLSG